MLEALQWAYEDWGHMAFWFATLLTIGNFYVRHR